MYAYVLVCMYMYIFLTPSCKQPNYFQMQIYDEYNWNVRVVSHLCDMEEGNSLCVQVKCMFVCTHIHTYVHVYANTVSESWLNLDIYGLG